MPPIPARGSLGLDGTPTHLARLCFGLRKLRPVLRPRKQHLRWARELPWKSFTWDRAQAVNSLTIVSLKDLLVGNDGAGGVEPGLLLEHLQKGELEWELGWG